MFQIKQSWTLDFLSSLNLNFWISFQFQYDLYEHKHANTCREQMVSLMVNLIRDLNDYNQ